MSKPTIQDVPNDDEIVPDKEPYTEEQLKQIQEVTGLDIFHMQAVVDAARLYKQRIVVEELDVETQRALTKINRLVVKLAPEYAVLKQDTNLRFYLNFIQENGLASLLEGIRLIREKPLPELTRKKGAKGYPRLQQFVQQLNDIFGAAFPEKKIALPHKDSYTDFYYGDYFHFMCACLKPLAFNDKTNMEIGHYLSNRVPKSSK